MGGPGLRTLWVITICIFWEFFNQELILVVVASSDQMDVFDYILILVVVFVNEFDNLLPDEASEKDQSELEEKMIKL